MPKLSIIIPIYNTGVYLHKCLKSILSQTLEDFELILVDDGSKDESGKICDEYAVLDKRIKVIHKENQGVSIARNTGIKEAQGDYIGFIDSDDWIDNDMYEKMYSKALEFNADIIVCDARTVYDNKEEELDTISSLPESTLLKKNDISPKILKEIAGSVWRCIYRRDVIISNEILFPEGMPLSEDRVFNILAMGCSNSMFYIKESFYNRYIREGSAVNRYYENMLDIVLDVRERMHNALNSVWNDKKYIEEFEKQMLQMVFTLIGNEFYKTNKNGFAKKYSAIKNICRNETIRKIVINSKSNDIRAKLVLKNNILLLCLIAKMQNIKYGR